MSAASDADRQRPLGGLLAAALIAGLIAGLLAAALQAAWVWPLIAQAEIYEEAADHAKAGAHDHATPHDEAAPAMRVALTVLTNIAASVGFALLMAAAMLLARRPLEWRSGLLWGACGYLAFVLGPAIGLQPLPPGVETGALGGRQMWWLATALCTAAALALLLLPRGKTRLYCAIAGVALIVLPHLIGAPADPPEGSAPPELRRQFALLVLLTTVPPWLATGALLGRLLPRFLRAP